MLQIVTIDDDPTTRIYFGVMCYIHTRLLNLSTLSSRCAGLLTLVAQDCSIFLCRFTQSRCKKDYSIQLLYQLAALGYSLRCPRWQTTLKTISIIEHLLSEGKKHTLFSLPFPQLHRNIGFWYNPLMQEGLIHNQAPSILLCIAVETNLPDLELTRIPGVNIFTAVIILSSSIIAKMEYCRERNLEILLFLKGVDGKRNKIVGDDIQEFLDNLQITQRVSILLSRF